MSEFKEIVLNQVLGFEKEGISLKSERISHHYANWRNPAADVYCLEVVSDEVIKFTQELVNAGKLKEMPKIFYGVPEGATKLGIITQYKAGEHLIFREPGSSLSKFFLQETSLEIIDKTKQLKPDCYLGFPAASPVKELAIITQYEFAKQSENYKIDSHILPMLRVKTKKHGVISDQEYLGTPKGNVVLVVDAEWAKSNDITQYQPENANIVGIVYSGNTCGITPPPKDVPVYQVFRAVEDLKNPESLLLIEDVTTTASSALKLMTDLKGKRIEVLALEGLTNRMELTPIPGIDDESVVQAFRAIYKKATGQKYETAMSVEEVIKEAGNQYFAITNSIDLLPEVKEIQKPDEETLRFVEEEFKKYGVQELKLL